MKTKTKIILFLFATIMLLSFQKDFALAGFGISPPSVTNSNLVPGSFYEQDIYLVQSNPDVDLNAVVKVDAGEINSWIKIENGNNFVIPKGMQQFPMKVAVTVPKDAKLGDYKGSIAISTSPAGDQKAGVSIVLGANVSIDLKVTSIKVSNFSIQNFQILSASKGSPIKLLIKVKNDGNVENGPTKASLTFFDQYHSKQLGQKEVFITEKAKSFEMKDITVEFPNDLNIGSYWADVKIYSDDKTIVDSKLVFDVGVGQASGLSLASTWPYILLIIIVLTGFVLYMKKRKHHNNAHHNIQHHHQK